MRNKQHKSPSRTANPVQLKKTAFQGKSAPAKSGAEYQKMADWAFPMGGQDRISYGTDQVAPDSPPMQLLRLDVSYNDGQGALSSNIDYLAKKPQDWYDSFPPDAIQAILTELSLLAPANAQETADIQSIQAKVRQAGANQISDFTYSWTSDTIELRTPENAKIAYAEFEEEDGNYWLAFVDTDKKYQKRGIGKELLRQAVAKYGKILASSATKFAHEQVDEDDTRWLTGEGAALVGSAVRAGIMEAAWYTNPFEQEEENYDDY